MAGKKIQAEDVQCAIDPSLPCYFMQTNSGNGQRLVGNMNGRYAFLFRLLCWVMPSFAFIITVFLIPFTTWVVGQQYSDIGFRERGHELIADVEELGKRIDELPPPEYRRRVERLEKTQEQLRQTLTRLLVNQSRIMVKMGLDPDGG